ncbi:MAG: glutamate-5-semialdehyde dehydrogenase [Thermotoga sp.]|nr:MAG: glutamate-5-semialdehyde dehydrogenase [Thermotoga sp.]
MDLFEKALKVKRASEKLRNLSARKKNEALMSIRESLERNKFKILEANDKDVKRARESGIKESLIDRLRLNEKRIDGMLKMIDTVVNLKDPVGEVIDSWVREDGLRISRVRVPIGAIGIIYESRPNVTLDATVLALKSGNSVLLRGGSDAFNSNMEIVRAIKDGLKDSDIPENSVEYVEDTSHEIVGEMLKLNGILDLIIPRGGSSLIKFVVENSTVPVLETGVGNCHIFVDESANLEKALDIIDNAKTQRPGTCNAVETVLIHEKIAEKILPPLVERLKKKGVEMRGCEKTREYVDVHPATEKDWETEYLDLILAMKVVKDVDEAINHIKRYSTGHSEAILTENYTNARKFISSIDSSAVYVNASTRLTDGGEFGFGGEMGISTQKLHARGPVGLRELTTYKFVILGDYHTRK